MAKAKTPELTREQKEEEGVRNNRIVAVSADDGITLVDLNMGVALAEADGMKLHPGVDMVVVDEVLEKKIASHFKREWDGFPTWHEFSAFLTRYPEHLERNNDSFGGASAPTNYLHTYIVQTERTIGENVNIFHDAYACKDEKAAVKAAIKRCWSAYAETLAQFKEAGGEVDMKTRTVRTDTAGGDEYTEEVQRIIKVTRIQGLSDVLEAFREVKPAPPAEGKP